MAIGIVITARVWGDHGRIADIYTREGGKVTAGTSAKVTAQLLQPLNLIEFVFSSGKDGKGWVQQCRIADAHLHLRQSLHALESASQMVAAVNATQQQHDANPQLFDGLLFCLQNLGRGYDNKAITALFLAKLLHYEGLLGYGDDPALIALAQVTNLRDLARLTIPDPYLELVWSKLEC